MQAIHRYYLNQMATQHGYRATWEPNKPLALGDIVKLQGGITSTFSNLEKEGIPMEVSTDSTEGSIDYSSKGSLKINVKLAGQTPISGSMLTTADAGFNIAFDDEKSILFQADNTLTSQIINLSIIEKEIIKRVKNGQWDKNQLVITEIMTAATATIIISYSENSKIDLKVNASISSEKLKLTDASLDLSVAEERGEHLKVLAQKGITPLYRVMGFRHPLFGKRQLSTRGEIESEAEMFSLQPFDPAELK